MMKQYAEVGNLRLFIEPPDSVRNHWRVNVFDISVSTADPLYSADREPDEDEEQAAKELALDLADHCLGKGKEVDREKVEWKPSG